MFASDPDPLSSEALDISDVERILCSPLPDGSIDGLLPRISDAWTTRFTSLDRFAGEPESTKAQRVCIATEEIVGPVRNGGIGTTYAHLAMMLAAEGNAVTVLYLRGNEVEVETIDHWIAWYAERGVRLVPVPDYAVRDRFLTAADRWLRAPYNMMRYLIEHPQDVVHVSEWRGSGYLSLLAKRQGIAFADTLFIVKTSSPWLWNRLYGSQPLERADDLVKVQAERQSVELADVVIGGSLHLLRWMASQGYAIPRDRTFVQPNVATFTTLEPLMQARQLTRGERTPINEIVFFGRLEARKGLFVFCQAIRRLIRKGVKLPPRITFMGKPGARMASHPDQTTPEYIRSVTEQWPCDVQILTEFQQFEAIEYLLGDKRLAVMPSIIENSSMAIYEAAICGIPSVCTNVGGNAELIHADDREAVLCQPHPVSVGDKLEEALALGGMVPRPSFDNDANLATWRRFHRQLGAGLRERLIAQAREPSRAAGSAGARTNGQPATSVCIYFTGDTNALGRTLASVAQQKHPAAEVLVAVDGDDVAAIDDARQMLAAHGFVGDVVDAFDLDAGAAFNLLAQRARGRFLLFLWEGAGLEKPALSALESIAASSGAGLLNYLHRVLDPADADATPPLRALVIGSASDSFCRNDTRELPLFVRAEAFRRLGGFTADYRVLGYDHEFVAKAQLAGEQCETALLELGAIQARSADWMRLRGYDLSASTFRVIRPKLAASPLGIRDLLLFARGLQMRGGAGGGKRKSPAQENVAKAEGLLARMITGLSSPEPAAQPPAQVVVAKFANAGKAAETARAAAVVAAPKAAQAQGATTEKPAGRGQGAAKRGKKRPVAERSGLLGLLDRYEDGSLVPAKRAPPPPARQTTSNALASLIERGEVASEGNLVGQFIGLHDGRLQGWVTTIGPRAGQSNRPLQVELTVDGVTTLHPASHVFPAMSLLPPEAMRHGFVIDLPHKPARSATVAWQVKVAGSSLMLGEGVAMAADAPLEKCGVNGFCDPGEMGLVYGWAWYPTMPDLRVDLAVFVDGAPLTRLRANREREDLLAGGIPQSDYGFQVMLPKVLREQGRHRIDVVVADSGIPLRRSPVYAEGMHVTVSELPRKKLFGWL
ncbi:glycosyltransferase [Novosphingobium sp.]|uniref:glycosyltransferase n=1 Tax=Novosphingobium sp. TaxID=1874826 RepID=UPI0038BDC94D